MRVSGSYVRPLQKSSTTTVKSRWNVCSLAFLLSPSDASVYVERCWRMAALVLSTSSLAYTSLLSSNSVFLTWSRSSFGSSLSMFATCLTQCSSTYTSTYDSSSLRWWKNASSALTLRR